MGVKGLGKSVVGRVVPLGVGLPLFVLLRVLDGLPRRHDGLFHGVVHGYIGVWIEVCEGDVLKQVRGDAVELGAQARVVQLVLLSSFLDCLWWHVLIR